MIGDIVAKYPGCCLLNVYFKHTSNKVSMTILKILLKFVLVLEKGREQLCIFFQLFEAFH